ncbi:MAG: hypothetical protein WCU00_03125 [Candidatus Latescibacterota bacterium]
MDKQSSNDYRDFLISAQLKSEEQYSKSIIILSGGALGISFAFVKDIIGTGTITNLYYLFIAWTCWGLSLTFVLFSFYTSFHSFRKAINQVDMDKIYFEKPGGCWSLITDIFHILGGILFFLGVIMLSLFIISNVR